MRLQLLYLLFAFLVFLLLFLGFGSGSVIKFAVQFLGHVHQLRRREALTVLLFRVLLRYGLVYLFEKHLYLAHKFCPVPFRGFPPYESVFVGFGLDLGAVDVLHIQGDEAFLGKNDHQLREKPR